MESSLRRRQIRDCARKVFAEKGYHAATIDDIIREAGVARGTFYRHFDGKRAVFDQLLDELFVSLELAIRRVDLADGAPPVVEQMLGNVGRVLGLLIDHEDLTRILLREAVGIDDEFDRKIGEFYARILSLIELSLKHGQEMGIVRPCDTRLGAQIVLGSVRQVMESALESRRDPPSPDVLGRELLVLLADGLFTSGLGGDEGGRA